MITQAAPLPNAAQQRASRARRQAKSILRHLPKSHIQTVHVRFARRLAAELLDEADAIEAEVSQ